MNTILGWHFTKADNTSQHGYSKYTYKPGQLHYTNRAIGLCSFGFHFSQSLKVAIENYASYGNTLSRVIIFTDPNSAMQCLQEVKDIDGPKSVAGNRLILFSVPFAQTVSYFIRNKLASEPGLKTLKQLAGRYTTKKLGPEPTPQDLNYATKQLGYGLVSYAHMLPKDFYQKLETYLLETYMKTGIKHKRP